MSLKERTSRISNLVVLSGILCAMFLLPTVIPTTAQQSAEQAPDSQQEPAPPIAADSSESCPAPNIVIFLIDTLRADRLGAYGYVRKETSPNIDRLGKEGVVFEHACAASPWTLPSVASLMTSTYPYEHRTLDDNDRLDEKFDTLPSALQRVGYSTINLYSNPYAGPTYGIARDYDYVKQSLHTDGRKVEETLAQHPARPFFLYIHNGEPHNPYDAHIGVRGFKSIPQSVRAEIKRHVQNYRRLTREDFVQKREIGTTDNTQEQNVEIAALNEMYEDYNELYDTSVHDADDHVGSVINSLKKLGEWENTLFIVLADHGEELSEHGGWLHDQSVYQELIHVPLIIRFPGDEHAGLRIKSVVSLVDIMPTILDFIDRSEECSRMRGKSLLPVVDGVSPTAEDLFRIFAMRWNTKKYYRPWKLSRGDLNLVVRHQSWKGIWNVETASFELYNLEDDPWEQNELAISQPDLSLAMRVSAKLWSLRSQRIGTERVQLDQELDEDAKEGLRSLGYID